MGTPIANAINLAPLERRLDKVAAATDRIERELTQTNSSLTQVTSELNELTQELNGLKASFERFMEDSKRATTLQKAATELIRVRQELEQNFGSYKVVRETMLGVLQATDLALVKKTTISFVTEELMLSTPDYWLAPCLVAVAAWIGNDRDLANGGLYAGALQSSFLSGRYQARPLALGGRCLYHHAYGCLRLHGCRRHAAHHAGAAR